MQDNESLLQLKADLAQIAEENQKLRHIIKKTSQPEAAKAFAKEMEQETRAENNAKFLAGELKVDPTEFEKAAKLIASQPDDERLHQWLKDIENLSWAESPLEACHRAALFASAYHLTPQTPISGKKYCPNVWFEILRRVYEFEVLITNAVVTLAGEKVAEIGEAFAKRSGVSLPNAIRQEAKTEAAKPRLILPGDGRLIKEVAADIIRFFKERCSDLLFRRETGGLCTLRKISGRLEVFPLSALDLAGLVDDYLTPGFISKEGRFITTSLCKRDAEALMNTYAIAPADIISNVVTAPLLIRRKGDAVVRLGYGYDRESHVFVDYQEELPVLTVEEAVKMVMSLCHDFFFMEESDKSRHLSGFFLPALCMGGFSDGDRPIDVTEALESQTGKGYRVKLVAAVYNETYSVVIQGKAGGKLDEAFDTEVIRGRPLILIENFRGTLDSQKIEAFITPVGLYTCRTLYATTLVDPRRYFVFITSNGAEVTEDLTERFLVTRLKKAPKGYQYWRSPTKGLSLYQYVSACQPKYLAAIQTIIEDWWINYRMKGGGLTTETRHSFRTTIQALDFIIQHYFGLPPIMDGMEQVKTRSTDAFLSFLRDLAIGVLQNQKMGERLRASDLAAICETKKIAIPGSDRNSTTETKQKRIGVILSRVLKLLEEEGRTFPSDCEGTDNDDLDRDPKLIKSLDIEGFHLEAWGVWDPEHRRPRRSFVVREGSASPHNGHDTKPH